MLSIETVDNFQNIYNRQVMIHYQEFINKQLKQGNINTYHALKMRLKKDKYEFIKDLETTFIKHSRGKSTFIITPEKEAVKALKAYIKAHFGSKSK